MGSAVKHPVPDWPG